MFNCLNCVGEDKNGFSSNNGSSAQPKTQVNIPPAPKSCAHDAGAEVEKVKMQVRYCVYNGCEAILKDIKRSYCPQHRCVESNCENLKKEDDSFFYRYCPQHNCSEPKCVNKKTEGFDVCSFHKPDQPKKNSDSADTPCVAKVVPAFNQQAMAQRHIIQRNCNYINCPNLCYGNYCPQHKCDRIGCGNLKKAGSNACEAHICQKPGCEKAVEVVLNSYVKYCPEHECEKHRCSQFKKRGC